MAQQILPGDGEDLNVSPLEQLLDDLTHAGVLIGDSFAYDPDSGADLYQTGLRLAWLANLQQTSIALCVPDDINTGKYKVHATFRPSLGKAFIELVTVTGRPAR